MEDYRPRNPGSDFDEDPSQEDIERFSDVTVECPECGATLHDDVEICWKCGHALGARGRAGVPRWVIVVAVLAAGLALLAIF